MPNQPKHPGRHLRMDSPRWEGLGALGAAQAGDRTKQVLAWLDWLFYAPDAAPPKRLPPKQLIGVLRSAAQEALTEAETEAITRTREGLQRRSEALLRLAAEVEERARSAGLLDE